MEPEKTDLNRIETPAMLRQLDREHFNPFEAVGGVRGAIESSLPALVFVIVYVVTNNLRQTLIAAVVTSVVLIVARLVTRETITYSVSGLIGVAIGVVWAGLSGRGENFYTIGLIAAGIYATAIAICAVVGYPLVSMLLCPVWQLPWKWWKQPSPGGVKLSQAGYWLTWLWFSMFALRFIVQLPLWLTGKVALLGTAKLALGLPPFIFCAWLTWIVLRPLKPTTQE
ncbi:MAG: DUF3159 domain-containing protein [Actinomycetaceae bacterium]|nr:DUF3159 domain-containing protein [Actinomycetaceae bacterium]